MIETFYNNLDNFEEISAYSEVVSGFDKIEVYFVIIPGDPLP